MQDATIVVPAPDGAFSVKAKGIMRAIHRMIRATALAVLAISVPVHAEDAKDTRCPAGARAFAEVRRNADLHQPAAQTALAMCYDVGRHVQPSRTENVRLLTEAAQQEYLQAESELGRIYLYGRGVPADYAKALRWEQKAADRGDARAQRDLAFMYERGLGVSPDPARATEWNRKAAEQNQPEAQMHLAQALARSNDPKDQAEALQWYARAAKHELPEAQMAMARERIRQKDCAGAIRWYKEAAGSGEAQAMFELGRVYSQPPCGNHGAEDQERAWFWFTLADRFQVRESRVETERIGASLTSAQKKRVAKMAERWIRKHRESDKEKD